MCAIVNMLTSKNIMFNIFIYCGVTAYKYAIHLFQITETTETENTSPDPVSSDDKRVQLKGKQWSGKQKQSFDSGDYSVTYVPAPPPYTPGTSDYSYSYSNSVTRQDTGFQFFNEF